MEITFFTPVLLIVGLFLSTDKVLRWFLVCFLFGGSAAISVSALGGAPVLPALFLLPFLTWRSLCENLEHRSIGQFRFSAPVIWVLLLVGWEVISAFLLPHLFFGETMIFGNDRLSDTRVQLIPLKLSSTNFTQSAYAVLGLICFVTVRSLLSTPQRFLLTGHALLVLAMLNVAAAVIQLAESYLNFPSLLNVLRNANYATFTSGEVGGLVRIYGTFSEASGFSAFTLTLVAFSLTLYRDGFSVSRSGVVAAAMIFLLLISTSTTAYVGLVAYLVFASLAAIGRSFVAGVPFKVGLVTFVAWFSLVLACIGLLLKPEVIDVLMTYFDQTVFNKLDSASGQERSNWNRQGWINFLETYGMGIGFGSARTSSFPMALLSNAGAIGVTLFLAFLLRTLRPLPRDIGRGEAAVMNGAKHAVVASMISGAVSGTMADPGLMFYALAAVASATDSNSAVSLTNAKSDVRLFAIPKPGQDDKELVL